MLAMALSMAAALASGPVATAATPIPLVLSQSAAFAILGHSCGGIQEQSFTSGFDPLSGNPAGFVYMQTRCGGSGRGGGYHVTTYSAWAAATWNFAGASLTDTVTAAPATMDPALVAVDPHGDEVYNTVTGTNVSACGTVTIGSCSYHAYLLVVPPAAPTAVAAVQSGDQFNVSWTPDPTAGAIITSSTVTATPVASTAAILTATAAGRAGSAVVGPLQPSTTYSITIVSNSSGGPSPASAAVLVTSHASSVPPAAPTGVNASWTAPGLVGDTLLARWQAATGGDSPVDKYQVTVVVFDGGTGAPAPSSLVVSGSTLSAALAVNDVYDWNVYVRAHDAAGWGAWSAPYLLGGA